MCSNYRPVTRSDRLLAYFGVERARDEDPVDVWPVGLAPFIRLAKDGSGNRLIADDGLFGLLPGFQVELAAGRKTYIARSETVHKLPSFRESWRNGWRCVIPAECIYEPCYETGRSVRWRIQLPGGAPMGIAGIYREWTAPDGRKLLTFAMLTRNADHHPLMKRMHKPDDEKRMVVLLEPAQYGEWLTCPVDAAAAFFEPWNGHLDGWPDPLPPRAPKATSGRVIDPSKDKDPGLF